MGHGMVRSWVGLVLLLAAAGCYDQRGDAAAESGSDEATDGREADTDASLAEGPGSDRPTDVVRFDAGADDDGGLVLECVRGSVSALHVEFECSRITVYTCKDLSNVVIEFEDGTRERFEGLKGNVNTFVGTGANATKRVVRVWVKAGANHSGDGPGYGERVETTTLEGCEPPPVAGNGGTGGMCVGGPDVPCGEFPSGGVGGGAGRAGEGGAGGEDANGPD